MSSLAPSPDSPLPEDAIMAQPAAGAAPHLLPGAAASQSRLARGTGMHARRLTPMH